eukprot:CAMPEP_0114589862 /NCGR_PEP_ID=MMETSP0125-20121206/12220_1 /TAXON_ID=485358 ORGANISM="Aristerostoma sp., Strain ATCC 50986" /NCGR_SAMPLE_ID=MMETSP0125 /ASSEMBLY_ACC=CAM_ASM_000245 /LENGTH=140 /DNA_ID=CAMNT_0001786993 /DNA_START=228 /DNA_END=650 /DNA_ORIENTATION=+
MAGTSFKSYYPVDEKNVLKKNAFNVLKETQQLTKLAQEHDNGEDEIEEIPPIDRLPVPGYQGYRPIYKNPIKKDKVKPKIRESDLKNIALGETRIEIDKPVPSVGYTGFVPGKKAENKYGRNYHNVIVESRLKQTFQKQG